LKGVKGRGFDYYFFENDQNVFWLKKNGDSALIIRDPLKWPSTTSNAAEEKASIKLGGYVSETKEGQFAPIGLKWHIRLHQSVSVPPKVRPKHDYNDCPLC
jgi:hypothetical protein